MEVSSADETVQTKNIQYSRLVSQFFLELVKSHSNLKKSSVFPWLEFLDEKEVQEFMKELAETFASSLINGQWNEFEEMIEDWQATAEANQIPELKESWEKRGNPNDYTVLGDISVRKV